MSLLSPTIMQQLCQAAILGYLDCIRIRGNHLMVLYNMCKKKFPNINTLYTILCQTPSFSSPLETFTIEVVTSLPVEWRETSLFASKPQSLRVGLDGPTSVCKICGYISECLAYSTEAATISLFFLCTISHLTYCSNQSHWNSPIRMDYYKVILPNMLTNLQFFFHSMTFYLLTNILLSRPIL